MMKSVMWTTAQYKRKDILGTSKKMINSADLTIDHQRSSTKNWSNLLFLLPKSEDSVKNKHIKTTPNEFANAYRA